MRRVEWSEESQAEGRARGKAKTGDGWERRDVWGGELMRGRGMQRIGGV